MRKAEPDTLPSSTSLKPKAPKVQFKLLGGGGTDMGRRVCVLLLFAPQVSGGRIFPTGLAGIPNGERRWVLQL